MSEAGTCTDACVVMACLHVEYLLSLGVSHTEAAVTVDR